MTETVSVDDVLRKYRFDFMRVQADQTVKLLDAIEKLLNHPCRSDEEKKGLLQDAADLISKHFRVREITIGLRNPKDGLFKLWVMTGLREETWIANKKLAFTNEQFFDDSVYKGKQLTKYTKLFLAESNPYAPGEEMTYNRPVMLKSTRRAADDSIEGDYLDTMIMGKDDKAIGWIEYSGTNVMKLPDASTVRWIELIAAVMAHVISTGEGVNTA